MSQTAKMEAEQVLRHLANIPVHASAAVDRKTLREIMLSTTGEIMAQGQMWTIQQKSLGGGIYRVSLTARHDEARETRG